MKIEYTKGADIMYVTLAKGKYDGSKKISDDILMDVSKRGKVLGFEIFYASKVAPELVKQFNLAAA